MTNSIFEVDRKGLAKILARRGKAFAVLELIQNAWDEDGVTEVHVGFSQKEGKAHLFVSDDAPEGFADLSHAYTLFAESQKKGNPEQRGRFNLGEKLVIAICDRFQVTTTKGTIVFDEAGRTHLKERIERGSMLSCEMRMNKQEATELEQLVASVIPPKQIRTTFNGQDLQQREPIETITVSLPTEIADEDGYLKGTRRKTTVNVYEPLADEKATIYEMGIPVVETGDAYHLDVQQKVPLNADRDNVRPAYLQELRTAVLNKMASRLDAEQSTKSWVGAALEDKNADVDAVRDIVKIRYGDKVVIYDPSDVEGTKIAVSQGYTVLAPRSFSKEAWENVRAAGVLPAGKVTPSLKPYGEGDPLKFIKEWTDDMVSFRDNVVNPVALATLGHVPNVQIANDLKLKAMATFGPGNPLILNLVQLGHSWFKPDRLQDQIALLLHEFAHDRVSDHLSHEFADEIARLGAKLVIAKPDFLELTA